MPKARKARHERNLEKERAQGRAHYHANKSRHKDRSYRRQYGISLEQYEAMHAAQEGKCKICNRPADPLVVDHNHETKKARDLLCKNCNFAIGLALENPETLRQMAAYLEHHDSVY